MHPLHVSSFKAIFTSNTTILHREDSSGVGPHLSFSVEGDNDPANNASLCWAYLGRQGAVGGKSGQTVNLGSDDCYNRGTYLHETMHSLGRY